MQLWRPEFELNGINLGSWYHGLVYQYGCIIDNESETMQQLCAK